MLYFSQVHDLEWHCSGCGNSNSGSTGFALKSTGLSQKIVSFNSDGTVILRSPERIALSSHNFSLQLFPVRPSDSGNYFCLVNGQKEPSLISKLVVQGKIKEQDTCAINDPLGQTHSPARSEHYSHLRFAIVLQDLEKILKVFDKKGRTDITGENKLSLRAVNVGWPRGSI